MRKAFYLENGKRIRKLIKLPQKALIERNQIKNHQNYIKL